MKWRNGIIFGVALLTLLGLTACATVRPPLPLAFGPTAKTLVGTIQWKQDKNAKPFHGEVVMRYQKSISTEKELLAMTVSKGPGMTFLEMQIKGDEGITNDDTVHRFQKWQMTIVPYHRTLSGHGSAAPQQLAIWLQMRGCAFLLGSHATFGPHQEITMPSPDFTQHQFYLSEFETIHQQRLPTRIKIVEPKTGASLEFKLGEIH